MNPTLVAYDPPLSKLGSALLPGQEPDIYPGVRGYAVLVDGLVLIPMIIGDGTGKVGEMLDRLSSRCRIVNVTSARLAGMLERRGYVKEMIYDDGEEVDYWRRP